MEQRVYATQQLAEDSQAFFYSLKSYPTALRFALVRERVTDGKWFWVNPTAEYLVGLNQSDLDKLDDDYPCTLEEYQNDWIPEE